MPSGFRIVLDRSVRLFRNATVLVGGQPGRLITLSAEGRGVLASLLADGTAAGPTGRLARRLVAAGMAHPQPAAPGPGANLGLTVVIPVHDGAESLDRCLASLGPGADVLVVDDASEDPEAVAAVCRHRRARLIRRPVNGGPAAARNQGAGAVDTPLVAFVDSDCTVGADWPGTLVALFEDPVVGAVAPRVRPQREDRDGYSRPSVLDRYNNSRSALDMGPAPSEVGPDRRVRYVPTAALVVRADALSTVGARFDAELRVGEDVDLVWRLVDSGWSVRYHPSVTVSHREPRSWTSLLVRRFRYGTSAGPLARRHPGRLAPVELRAWSATAALAVVFGRYRSAAALTAVATVLMAARLRGRGIPLVTTIGWSTATLAWAVVGIGRAVTTLAAPLPALAVRGGRRGRVGAALLVLGPPLVEWVRRRPGIDPVRWSLASVADDVAYGAGVWVGCLRSGSLGPLVPRLRR